MATSFVMESGALRRRTKYPSICAEREGSRSSPLQFPRPAGNPGPTTPIYRSLVTDDQSLGLKASASDAELGAAAVLL